jgi:hypothetical protein
MLMQPDGVIKKVFLTVYSVQRRINPQSQHWYLFNIAAYLTFLWLILTIAMLLILITTVAGISPLQRTPAWVGTLLIWGGGGLLFFAVEFRIAAFRSGVSADDLCELSSGKDIRTLSWSIVWTLLLLALMCAAIFRFD